MKKYIFTSIALIISIFNSCQTSIFQEQKPINKELVSYILKVLFPTYITKIPDICLYYRGYKINFDEDICIISQPFQSNQFILVVTSQVNHKSEGNNVKYLERIENNLCRVFYITSKFDSNNQIISWSIEEEDIENMPLRLPEESLVLLMDPSLIDSVKQYSNNRLEKIKSSCKIINLPEIIIRQDVTSEQLNSMSNHIWLASFDSNAIHVPVKKVSKEKGEVVMSMKLLER